MPGSYSFQMNVTCYNQSSVTVSPVLTLMFISSGFFTCAAGKSSQTTTPISEADVLSTANATTAYSSGVLARKLGRGFGQHLGSWLSKVHHRVRAHVQEHGARIVGDLARAALGSGSARERKRDGERPGTEAQGPWRRPVGAVHASVKVGVTKDDMPTEYKRGAAKVEAVEVVEAHPG